MESNHSTDALLRVIRDARETLATNKTLFERMAKGELGALDPKARTFVEQHLAVSQENLKAVDVFLSLY